MTPSPYEYILILCIGFVGILTAICFVIQLVKDRQDKEIELNEEKKRKKYLDALFGRGKYIHKYREKK